MRSSEERVAVLDRLIRQEFHPIVDNLVRAACLHLETQQASTLKRATLVYMGLVEVMQEQARAHRARIRVLMASGDGRSETELRRVGEARVSALNQQISKMEYLVRKLQDVDQTSSEGSAEAPLGNAGRCARHAVDAIFEQTMPRNVGPCH